MISSTRLVALAARAALAALVALAAAPASAQHDHHAPAAASAPAAPGSTGPAPLDAASAAFVAAVREGTAPFKDLSAAIAAGYRPLGPDMPNMGEHWVNPALAIRTEIDPARPSVLTYIRVDGRPVLTGAAFTRPVRPGERVPPPPVGPGWHFHAADLDMEAYGLSPHGASHGAEESDRVRLAMLHAWVWADNPDGVFHDDHWGLAYLRLGLSLPSRPDADAANADAAKALFLLAGGTPYFARMFVLAGLTEGERARADALLDDARRGTEAALAPARADGALSEADVAALAAPWAAFRESIHALVGHERAGRFGML